MKLQDTDNATIPELIKLSAPDSPILLLAFTAGAAAALGQASTLQRTQRLAAYASVCPCADVPLCHWARSPFYSTAQSTLPFLLFPSPFLPFLPTLQALIPYYTGKIIDFASIDPDPHRFRETTLKMLGVALGCAVFTGVRGGLFTVAMTRLNVRLRQQLFHSLMHQVGGP